MERTNALVSVEVKAFVEKEDVSSLAADLQNADLGQLSSDGSAVTPAAELRGVSWTVYIGTLAACGLIVLCLLIVACVRRCGPRRRRRRAAVTKKQNPSLLSFARLEIMI